VYVAFDGAGRSWRPNPFFSTLRGSMPGRDTYRFGPFRLIPAARLLLEGDAPLRVGSRAFDILVALVERAGETIANEELLARVWPDVAVDDVNLRVHITALRKVLGDGRGGTRYIGNVPLRGYRFLAPLSREPEGAPDGVRDAQSRSMSGGGLAGRLPLPMVRLVGRDDAVAALERQLVSRRFVTVVGPAGIGKTSLALAAAQRLAPSFPSGVLFVDLASVAESRHVASALASIVGVSPPSGDTLGALGPALANRKVLLVLDNCEHVATAAAALAEATLRVAPDLAVLATSREPLRARGEWVSRLGPLPVPGNSELVTAESAATFSAIELFVERASASLDGFELPDADAPSVAELCRKLDGNPLAIELAAARIAAFGVRGLLARLDDRFRLMMSGHRTALPRQQTLRGAMDWSYDTLSEGQRRVLRRLAVFPGWFDLSAAIAVTSTGTQGVPDTVEDLAELVDKSLVTTDVSGAAVLYRLLGTTRAYAFEKLIEHHESDPAQKRHAEYTLAQVQIGSASGDPSEIERKLDELGGLIDDVRAGLRWAFSQGADVGLAIELAIASAPLGAVFSLHEEFCAYLERASVALSSMPSADPRTALRLALAHGALAVHSRGDYSAFLLAHELAEAHGSDRERELALEGIWSRNLFGVADYEYAVSLAQQHVAATSKQPSAARLNSQRMLGLALHFSGRHTAAREQLELVMSHETSQHERAALQLDPRISAGISLSRIHWL
jgi:predicted ATPase/DNA-binding winged helix-turn-helix (wHTH) protein